MKTERKQLFDPIATFMCDENLSAADNRSWIGSNMPQYTQSIDTIQIYIGLYMDSKGPNVYISIRIFITFYTI